MSDKIEDNSSFEEFRNDLKGGKAVKKIVSFLAPFSKRAKNVLDAFENFDELEKQFEEISKSPDKFNHYFRELGWIAHESANHDLILECIRLAESNKLKDAEEKLADYYTSEDMRWMVSLAYGTPELRIRNDLINAAFEDTKAKRFGKTGAAGLADGLVKNADVFAVHDAAGSMNEKLSEMRVLAAQAKNSQNSAENEAYQNEKRRRQQLRPD